MLLVVGGTAGFQGHDRKHVVMRTVPSFPSSRRSAFLTSAVPQNVPSAERLSMWLAVSPKNGASNSYEKINGKGDRSISSPEDFLLALEDMEPLGESSPQLPESKWSYDTTVSQLIQAASVGAVTGALVAVFKLVRIGFHSFDTLFS